MLRCLALNKRGQPCFQPQMLCFDFIIRNLWSSPLSISFRRGLIKTKQTSTPKHVFYSYCCYSKLPQTYWLKTTQVYYFTVWGVRSLKWVTLGKNRGVDRAGFPLESPMENLSPCLSWLLEATSILWLGALSSFSKPAVAGPVFLM